ncbi:MAG: sigma factor [Clostridium sp.]
MAFFFANISKPLTPGEGTGLPGTRLQEGDREARDILIERNLRLVAHVAKKYQGTDYEQDDLLSVGTIGLIKAVNTFHPEQEAAWLPMRQSASRMKSS